MRQQGVQDESGSGWYRNIATLIRVYVSDLHSMKGRLDRLGIPQGYGLSPKENKGSIRGNPAEDDNTCWLSRLRSGCIIV